MVTVRLRRSTNGDRIEIKNVIITLEKRRYKTGNYRLRPGRLDISRTIAIAITRDRRLKLNWLLRNPSNVSFVRLFAALTAEHDFDVAAFELWFRQILREINSIRTILMVEYLEERNSLCVISRLNRVIAILKVFATCVSGARVCRIFTENVSLNLRSGCYWALLGWMQIVEVLHNCLLVCRWRSSTKADILRIISENYVSNFCTALLRSIWNIGNYDASRFPWLQVSVSLCVCLHSRAGV